MAYTLLTAFTVTIVVILVTACSWYRCRPHANPRGLPLPPGPSPIPILGNLFDFPLEKPWEVYHSMAEKYGDVMYLNVLGQPIVILGSLQTTTDLLEKRSAKYSDRLYLTMISELMGFKWAFSIMPYGDLWRRHRRAFHQQFMPPAAKFHWPTQMAEAHKFIRRISESPDNVSHHIRHTFSAIIMMVSYGIEVSDTDDEYIIIAEEALCGFAEAAAPGAFIVDLIPILKYIPAWVPGATFHHKAQHWRPYVIKMAEWPWQIVKDALQTGTQVTPCIAKDLLESLPEGENRTKEEHIRRDMLAAAYGAGADTIVSAVETFLLAMAMHTEVQVIAQKELDAVVGSTRLPTFEDRKSLPYIDAIINEVLRWQPVTPLAVAHYTAESDEYQGYFIPKGSVILPNAWAILHDPAVYPNPEAFMPERFLINGKINRNVPDPRLACFGFGRRICPGRAFADSSLYAVIVSTLHVYSVSPVLGESGSPLSIKLEMSSGVISHPKPFKCSIIPRSAATAALLEYDENVPLTE